MRLPGSLRMTGVALPARRLEPRRSNYLGTDDPSINPNTGSTGDWKQMQPRKP
jgi:hypothetical protein